MGNLGGWSQILILTWPPLLPMLSPHLSECNLLSIQLGDPIQWGGAISKVIQTVEGRPGILEAKDTC